MNLKRAFLILMVTMLLPGYALAQDISIGMNASVDFDDGNPDETITVTFSCNDGNNPNAVVVLGDGDTFRHPNDGMADTFVCTVTATDVNENYFVTYSSLGVTSPIPCEFDNDDLGETNEVSCAIEAFPETATIGVTKVWNLEGAGGEPVFQNAQIRLTAAEDVLEGGDSENCAATAPAGSECVILTFIGDSPTDTNPESPTFGELIPQTVEVNTDVDGVTVSLAEINANSAVEVSNDCGGEIEEIEPGDSVSCGFTNTVFFEGIPTLSQYGMAIMVLLMLGVGFVGFRRFV